LNPSTSVTWRYLGPNPKSYYKQLFVKGMGIDTNRATVTDLTGRPQYLVDGNAQPLRELI